MTKQRVIALMSGGVDSSVTAALLKEQGYDVLGVYILGWTGTEEFPCSWQDEEADARKVAEKIGISFHTVNLSKEYEKAVIDNFFSKYQEGLTPNPDILCNQEIKFKATWRAVRQFEPDFIATGHYARILNKGTDKTVIAKGLDDNKDQSYFLWGIEKPMLSKIIFPLGEMEKKDVRKLAEKYDLPTAKKKDSQGICFVGPLKVREFLKSRVKAKPGNAVLPTGEVVARHDGVELYTIGQRLGAGSVDWTGDIPPLFVAAKDIKNNLLIVSNDSDIYAKTLFAINANWHKSSGDSFSCLTKVRYRQADVPATVSKVDNKLRVVFEEPVRAITPGQSIVFYTNTGELLGGAVISSVPNADELVQKVHGRRQKTTAS